MEVHSIYRSKRGVFYNSLYNLLYTWSNRPLTGFEQKCQFTKFQVPLLWWSCRTGEKKRENMKWGIRAFCFCDLCIRATFLVLLISSTDSPKYLRALERHSGLPGRRVVGDTLTSTFRCMSGTCRGPWVECHSREYFVLGSRDWVRSNKGTLAIQCPSGLRLRRDSAQALSLIAGH